MKRIAIIVLAVILNLTARGEEQDTNPWEHIEFLIRTWTEKTEKSTVKHAYEWVLGGQFIKSTTDAHFHPKDGKESTHQDVGYFSFDKGRGKVVFRQFHSEGFINTYVFDERRTTDSSIVLATEHTENAGGMRAELTISKKSEKEYEMILYLPGKEGEFKACQWKNATKEGKE